MKETRRKFSAEFKAQVSLDAVRERETLAELAKKYELSPVVISRWKREFIGNSKAAFESKGEMEEESGKLEMKLDLPSVSIGVAWHNQNKFCFCAR
jgi:transposase-like protein